MNLSIRNSASLVIRVSAVNPVVAASVAILLNVRTRVNRVAVGLVGLVGLVARGWCRWVRGGWGCRFGW